MESRQDKPHNGAAPLFARPLRKLAPEAGETVGPGNAKPTGK